MPRFFIEDKPLDGVVTITGEDAHHIGFSLRMKAGERITATYNGMDYECIISSISPDTVIASIESGAVCETEPNVKLTLFQALPKADKFEHIIQKSVELGVCEIIPFISKRCVVKLSAEEFEKKRQRYNKIALAAAKQSGRGIIPVVKPLITLNEIADKLSDYDTSILFYEKSSFPISEVGLKSFTSVSAIIGSEGGFDHSEAEQLEKAGAYSVSLGNRILRCETAPTVAITLIFFLTNNL